MRIAFRLCMLLLAFGLAGCQTAAPVPKDKFYRLEVAPRASLARAVLKEAIYVAPLRAEGPYGERAMLYAQASQPRELQQYHYHLWSEPPAVLLQEHMRASFEAMGLAPRVTDSPAGDAIGYFLNARVLRLEKITDDGGGRAVVSLQFSLQRKKPATVLLERAYTEEVVLKENTQHGYVIATEAALKKIYDRLAEDLKSLP